MTPDIDRSTSEDEAIYRRQRPWAIGGLVVLAVVLVLVVVRPFEQKGPCILFALSGEEVCGDRAKRACTTDVLRDSPACLAIRER